MEAVFLLVQVLITFKVVSRKLRYATMKGFSLTIPCHVLFTTYSSILNAILFCCCL